MIRKTVPAGELMVKRGGSINPAMFPDEVIDLLSIPAFDKGTIEVLPGKEIGSSKCCVQENDVLLSKIIPHIRRCWVVPKSRERRQIGSGEWIIFRSTQHDPNYLKHFLASNGFHAQFMNTVAGVGGSLLRARPAALEKIPVPLPPLDVQKRIAAILDKADSIRRKRQQAIAHTDQLLRSVFLDMFGDPISNPKKWPKCKFGDVTVSRLGKMLDAKQQTGLHQHFYLRNPNVQWGKVVLHELQKMDFDEDDAKEFELRHGDLLICEGGEVGRSAIWRGELKNCYYQKALHRVRPNTDIVNSEYICDMMWFLAKGGGLSVHTSSATIAHLTGERLKEIEIPIPPIALQGQYRTIIEKLRGSKASLIEAQEKLDNLFDALSVRAFSGDVMSESAPS